MKPTLFALVVSSFAAAAHAAPCEDLIALSIGDAVPDLSKEAATCSVSRILGGTQSKDCYWSFDYRASGARDAFEKVTAILDRCAEMPVVVERASVNHPDSFDQITGIVQDHAISVSLKDKGNLNKTLVFLRVAQ